MPRIVLSACFFSTLAMLASCGKKEAPAVMETDTDPIQRLLQEKPAGIVVYEPKDGEFDAVKAKVEAFTAAVDGGKDETLELTEYELMVYMTGAPDQEQHRESVVWSVLDHDDAECEVVLETEFLIKPANHPGGYLNAIVCLDFIPGREGLDLKVDRVVVAGKDVDAETLAILREEPFLKEHLGGNERLAAILRRAKSFRFRGFSVVFDSAMAKEED